VNKSAQKDYKINLDFNTEPKKAKSKRVIARRDDEAICCSTRYRLLRFARNDGTTFLDWTHLLETYKLGLEISLTCF
jgi:hypothetical protein